MNDYGLLVITSYPEKGKTHGDKTGGVASYTKVLLSGLKKQYKDLRVGVYADAFGRMTSYQEDGVDVMRRWRRGDFISVWKVMDRVAKSGCNHVLVSFEAYMFGPLISSSWLVLGLMWMKLKGSRVTLLLHQVIDDFHRIETNWLKASLLNVIKDVFYWVVKRLSTQVVVFEYELKRRMGNGERVYVLPHLVPKPQMIAKRRAKKVLGWSQNKRYAMYFGFLSLYKGVDWLLENWPEDSGYELIVAGGMSNTQKNHPEAIALKQKLDKLSAERGMKLEGFVPEKMVKYYFSAADVVILPYRVFMSSSGPLALALAYEKPVLISEVLKSYEESDDFILALRESGLGVNDLVFRFSSKSLKKALKNVSENEVGFQKFARKMKFFRSRSFISRVLFAILSREEQFNLRPVLLSRYLKDNEKK